MKTDSEGLLKSIYGKLLLSFGSGVAALIYEIVWFQLLELVIGSTAVSLGILLATFMGGMCLGSLILRRLRVYTIEFGIAICGILVLFVMPFVGSVYSAAACLLPPTLLMGATLPAFVRHEEASRMGFLYGANIAGGVLGCLLTGFYLLRVHDVATATYVAVAINVAVAVFAFTSVPRPASDSSPAREGGGSSPTVYIAIALSGLCALGAEAIWTRTLSLLFGASVYTFSIILAVFLTGLGIGSAIGSLLCRSLTRPRFALGWCQLLLAAAIAWTAYSISASLPYWPIDPSISSNIWFNFELDLARASWALLPATLLWGASFPLALAAASDQQESSRLFARIYAANTVGAILGALGANLLLVAWIGSQRTEQVLIALSIVSGLVLLPRRWILFAAIGCLSIYSVPPVSKLLIAYGRYAATWVGKSDIVYAREGMNSSVAVASFPNGSLTFHVAGKVQASNVPRDMRLQRMLGHLTTLTAANPHSVLVIGCGAGITAGAVSIDPKVQRETIVEIEPLVPQAASAYFSEPNFDVLRNPKVQLRIDDGRHYLLTTKEKFDGITVDPLDPWVKGAANLYTLEFLEAMKRHLNPGGTATMYIQLFETNQDAVKSAVATFFEIFPNGTVWGNPYQGKGHDMVLLGTVEPLRIDLDEMEHRVGYRDDSSKMPQSLAEVGMNSPVDLFATYAGRAADLQQWLKGAAINRDRNLRMQYLAGIGLNADESAAIYAGMLAYRRFPDDLFVSAEGRVDSLREAIRRAQ
ncbi:MAG TPA: fused MFS/spermidine synthase [Bryobacteraceae bacterium]|nr:fused MFS/spermidine synthase [Bryobacteraceae bacterium]